MFSKIGFFRFVSGYEKPVESLEAAIKAHGDVGGSLIVLPEAFNIGKYYWDEGECDHDRSILDRLQSVARSFDVKLVAGIIIDEPDGTATPVPPYSSVYLIHGSLVPVLICRKMENDGSKKYKPCDTDYVRIPSFRDCLFRGRRDHFRDVELSTRMRRAGSA